MSQASPVVSRDPFDLFPPELCHMVLEHLDAGSVAAACAVSRRWSALSVTDTLWKKLHDQAPWLSTADSAEASTSVTSCPPLSWKCAFASRRSVERNWAGGKYTTFTVNTGYKVSATRLQGRYFFTGHTTGAIRMWDLMTRTLIDRLVDENRSEVRSIELDAMEDGDSVLVCGHHSGALAIWHISFTSGHKVAVRVRALQHCTKAHDKSIETVRMNDYFVVTGSVDNTIKVWKRPKEGGVRAWSSPLNHLRTLKGQAPFVSALRLSGNDTLVSAAPGTCTNNTWDLKTGCCISSYQRPSSVAYAHFDGQKVVSNSDMCLYDERARRQVSILSDPKSVTLGAQGFFQGAQAGNAQLVRLVTVGSKGCTIWRADGAGAWVEQYRLVDASACWKLGRGVKPPVPRHLQVDQQRVVCSLGERILLWEFSG